MDAKYDITRRFSNTVNHFLKIAVSIMFHASAHFASLFSLSIDIFSINKPQKYKVIIVRKAKFHTSLQELIAKLPPRARSIVRNDVNILLSQCNCYCCFNNIH